MNRIIGYTDFVEYRLISEFQGSVVIEEPINFEEGNDNIYERDDDSKGFLTTRTNTLEFYSTGANFLRRQIDNRGVAEAVILRKYIKSEDRLDQEWRLVSTGFVDMQTLTFDEGSSSEGIAKAKLSEGGLKKIIDSKFDDQYDLTISEDFDGNDIGQLLTRNILLEPKKIFLRSKLEVESGQKLVFTTTNNDNDDGRSVPFLINVSSDENIAPVIIEELAVVSEDYTTLVTPQQNAVFYSKADRTRTLVFNGTVELEVTDVRTGSGNISGGRLELAMLRYIGGEDFDFGGRINDETLDVRSGNITNGVILSYQFINYEVTLQTGDSLALGVLGNNLTDGIDVSVNTAFLEVTEDSSFPATNARALTYYDATSRLMQLMTGRSDAVISSLLTEGTLSTKLITQGFWVRGFPDVVDEGTEEERRYQFTLSMKDLFEDINVHEPLAWWVEEGSDGLEYLRIEEYGYTQQGFVGIPYANSSTLYTPASDVQRKVLGDNFFSTITIGAKKGGDGYEEVFGLQSIQGKAEYGTINSVSESKYEAISPFRLGDIDVELPRRKQFADYPDEDTKYDSDKIVIDCKIINGQYYLKKWDDSFAEPPSGLYDYVSAYNLEQTPARLLLKHGSIINSGLVQYPNERIRFQSSNCNSSFVSRKTNENTLSEGADIEHERLEKPYIRPWGVELVCEVTQEIEDKITGTTEGIPNWFGLVAIEIRGNIEYFRLIKADVNGEGKHELVEAYLG